MALLDLELLSFSFLFKLAASVLLLAVFRIIYRLTLHPLAKFPGPRLAGATSLYAARYNLFGGTNSYVKQLPELHEQYGPIIRTHPDELSIHDIDAYNQIFKANTKFDKHNGFYFQPQLHHSLFNIPDSKTAKPRKDMLQPYFSKAAICRAESLIQEKVLKFMNILEESAGENKLVNLTLGYRCLTSDISMNYAYQQPFGALDAPDFQFPLLIALDQFFQSLPWTFYFPSVFRALASLATKLPTILTEKYLPPLAATQWIEEQCCKRILDLKNRPRSDEKALPTIFDTMLEPSIEKGQYTPTDAGLSADAFMIFSAGSDTTGHALCMGTYHILSNPPILQKLQADLQAAIPDKSAPVTWNMLEKLPYLVCLPTPHYLPDPSENFAYPLNPQRAIIHETLRLSYGAPGKLPRVTPPGTTLCNLPVPTGTIVTASTYIYHASRTVFPSPESFIPERWLGPNAAELESKMLSFSRGSRGCLGTNLALAQLYLGFGQVFRWLELKLQGMEAGDMEWRDCFTPVTVGKLKVVVLGVRD